LYYNYAAESFLSKKLCSRLHSIEVEFYSKKEKLLFYYCFETLQAEMCRRERFGKGEGHFDRPF